MGGGEGIIAGEMLSRSKNLLSGIVCKPCHQGRRLKSLESRSNRSRSKNLLSGIVCKPCHQGRRLKSLESRSNRISIGKFRRSSGTASDSSGSIADKLPNLRSLNICFVEMKRRARIVPNPYYPPKMGP
jgi:ribosomal protein L15E